MRKKRQNKMLRIQKTVNMVGCKENKIEKKRKERGKKEKN